MQRATQRWSTQVDLWLIFLAAALWYCWPQARGIPLILLVLAFIVRKLQHRFIIERTAFELPLALFLLTALVGVWAAYNHQDAWAKIWSILGAVAIFYGLASQPKERLWLIAELLSMIAVIVAATFLLSSPAPTQTADLPVIERIQYWLNNIHLFGYLPTGQPNQAGGILAMLLPFSIAQGIHALHNRRRAAIWFSFATGGFILTGLFITSSRGAWFALAIGLCAWLIWGLSGTLTRHRQAATPRIFVLIILTASMAAVITLNVVLTGGVVSLVKHLPGLQDFGTRIHIFQNTLLLIADFPITGGGLAAFAGLYSQYILSIPYFMFAYSHNLYLDVALEQGVFGFIAFLATLLICAGLLWHHISTNMHLPDQSERMSGRSGDQVSLLSQAALVGLMVIAFHGLLDDPFYNTQGAPLLFVFGALANAITKASFEVEEHAEITTSDFRVSQGGKLLNYWGMAILPVIVLVALVYDFRDRWLSTWYADTGALQMAHLELAGFPTYKWDDSQEAAKLTNAIRDFKISLNYDPNNLTGHYRLGLIAMLQRNFPEAASQLESSLRLGINHPGIRKNLGYSLVWMARYNRARPLLQDIPEARDELETYVWWWQNHGRKDLAGHAGQMAKLLEGKG